ncbi:MAG: ABC transporter permease [Bacillota bacterium]|jgi:peptide/nickel transport system permease protein
MYWLKKTAGMLATLFLVSILTFVALYLIPGDPALLILGAEADPQALDLVREQLGLNKPIAVQYLTWLGSILRGDFGQSITFSRGYSVASLIADALPVTIPLALAAVGLSLAIAIPVGALAASRRGSLLDKAVLSLSQAGLSIPAFWLGILGIQFFAVELGWFPPGSMPRWSVNPGGAALALVLPSLILALPRAAILTRMVRAAMLEALGENYIRAARGRGVRERAIIFRHGLANALVSISTVAGIQLVQLLAGTVVVEQVFSLPGLGRLILAAVLLRDLPLVQGAIFVGAAMILLVNFSLDTLYPILDPRIRGVE